MVLFLSKYKEKFQAKIPQLEFKIQIHFGTIEHLYQCVIMLKEMCSKKCLIKFFCCAIRVYLKLSLKLYLRDRRN